MGETAEFWCWSWARRFCQLTRMCSRVWLLRSLQVWHAGWKSLMWRILAFLRKLWKSCLRKVMGVYRAIDVLEVWKTVFLSFFWLMEFDGFCCCYYICLTCLILVIYICLPVEKHCLFALDSNLTHLWRNPWASNCSSKHIFEGIYNLLGCSRLHCWHKFFFIAGLGYWVLNTLAFSYKPLSWFVLHTAISVNVFGTLWWVCGGPLLKFFFCEHIIVPGGANKASWPQTCSGWTQIF